MDKSSKAVQEPASTGGSLREVVALKRAEAEQWLADERQRLLAIESDLSGHIEEISRQLSTAQWTHDGEPDEIEFADLQGRAEDLDARADVLKRQALVLARLHEDLIESQDRWHRRQERLANEHVSLAEQFAAAQHELEERRTAVRHAEDALAAAERQFKEQQSDATVLASQLANERQRLDEARRHLDEERAELDRERINTRRQRRRIAVEFKQRREELRQQAAALHSAAPSAEPSATEHEAAAQLSADVSETLTRLGAEVEALRHERDALMQRLSAAEAGGTSTTETDAAHADKMYELQRRFELAVEDMRNYKHRVAELEEQLALMPQVPAVTVADGSLDWAAQKQQMLSAMEGDFKDDDPKHKADRLTVEGAIRITDDVVAARDQEIADLKRQLEEPRGQAAPVRDPAVVEVLNHDAVVVEERERLRKLQQDVCEKQRKAEVELSIERAKFARDRLELEDQIHALKSELAKRPETTNGAASPTGARSASAKPVRGRWLARLGLKDADDAT